MKLRLLLILGIVFFQVKTAVAQGVLPEEKEGVQSFQQDRDAWRRSGQANEQTFLPGIADSIGQDAVLNLSEAEQVFCYEVDTKTIEYTGYTIDGMAVTGFCGVLNNELKKLVLQELFMSPQNVVLNQAENCIIKPRIMLRFVRGIDNVDVLLSSPCYSFSVFYGGKIKTFNAKPASEVIDALINPLVKKSTKFISPALLNQLLPVGVAQTQEQKELVNKKVEPIRGWEAEKPVTPESEPIAPKTGTGWNKLIK